jgi:hypothetical protein
MLPSHTTEPMDYPTYADAQELAEQEAESYVSKHACELTARLMDYGEPDEQTSHDNLGWCAFYAFEDARTLPTGDIQPFTAGAAIIWEHDDGRVTLEELGDYAEVYAAWQSYYVTRWDDDTTTEETDDAN